MAPPLRFSPPSQPQPADLPPIAESTTDPQALALTTYLNAFLHFVAPDKISRQQQTAHLHAVVMESARLGYVLLSHPGDWRFVAEESLAATGLRTGVVCAGPDRLGGGDDISYSPS